MKKACPRCARRLARSGYRRRCADCRAALSLFRKAARVLLALEVDPREPDARPVFEAFRPWLYCGQGGTLHVLELDPEARVHRSTPWAI